MIENKISIVITNRNTLDFLKLAVRSIFENTESKDYELIIMDDNSTDGSKDWLRENRNIYNFSYNTHDELSRKGIVNIVQEGIDLANNEIIFVGHADMIYGKKWDTNLLKHLKPKTILTSTRIEPGIHGAEKCKIIKEFGRFADEFKEKEFNEYVAEVQIALKDYKTDGVFAPNMFYKSDWIGYDKTFIPQSREDDDLYFAMKQKGYNFIQSWDSLVYHFTCRGSRYQTKELKDSDEWKASNSKNTKNFIRKWRTIPLHTENHHPIIAPDIKITTSVLMKNEGSRIYNFLDKFEPYFDEIIIADDYSVDDSVSEIKRYIKDTLEKGPTNFKKDKIKIFERSLNMDFSSQTNAVTELATNEWVMKCFVPETTIITLEGQNNIAEIIPGRKVLTVDGSFQRVKKVFSREMNDDVIKLKTRFHSEYIKSTKEHPFLCIRRKKYKKCPGNLNMCNQECPRQYAKKGNCTQPYLNFKKEWVNAESLEIGDILLIPKPNFKTKNLTYDLVKRKRVTPDLCRLFGYYLAEGNTEGNGRISFSFNKNEIEYQKDVISLMKKYFNLNQRKSSFNSTNGIQLRFQTNKGVASFFNELFGRGCYNKKLPSQFFNLSQKHKLELFKGWFFGDGTKSKDNISAITTSKTLAYQFSTILLSINVLPRIEYVKYKNPKQQKAYKLLVGGKQLEKLNIKHPFVSMRARTYNLFWQDELFFHIILKDIKREKYVGKVYNLEVEKNNTYVVERLIVHNCDVDEHMDERSLNNLRFAIDAISKENPNVKVIGVPRINTLNGVLVNDIPRDKWTSEYLTSQPQFNPRTNLDLKNPDYQFRLFKKDVKWVNPVHEVPEPVANKEADSVIITHNIFLFHPKTIDKQNRQNEFYNAIIQKVSKCDIKNINFNSIIYTWEGITKHAREEAKELKKLGYNIFLTSGQYQSGIDEEMKNMYDVFDLNEPHINYINQPPIRENNPSLSVLGNLWRPNLVAYLSFEGIPPKQWVDVLNHQNVKMIFVPSNYVKTCFIEGGIKDKDKIKIIPHGINPEQIRKIEPYQFDKFTFLWAGTTNNRRKGYDLAIRAFLDEFDGNEKVQLVLKVNKIYDPRQNIHNLVKKYSNGRKTDNIKIIEENLTDDEMYSLIRGCNCLVHPHLSEGFGIIMLEALALGTPLIATKASGNLDFCNEENTLFIEVKDRLAYAPFIFPYDRTKWYQPKIESLRRQMRYVYENYETCKKKSDIEAEKVLTTWTWENTAKLMDEEFKKL